MNRQSVKGAVVDGILCAAEFQAVLSSNEAGPRKCRVQNVHGAPSSVLEVGSRMQRKTCISL